MKKLRNFIILVRNWKTIAMAVRVVNDAEAIDIKKIRRDTTEEELQGARDLETFSRLVLMNPTVLKRELKHLKELLIKN